MADLSYHDARDIRNAQLLREMLSELPPFCAEFFRGITPETTPLMLVRPVSGSGALAVGSDLIATYGPDSYIGRVAAVMLGSTETTSSPGPASASITR